MVSEAAYGGLAEISGVTNSSVHLRVRSELSHPARSRLHW